MLNVRKLGKGMVRKDTTSSAIFFFSSTVLSCVVGLYQKIQMICCTLEKKGIYIPDLHITFVFLLIYVQYNEVMSII